MPPLFAHLDRVVPIGIYGIIHKCSQGKVKIRIYILKDNDEIHRYTYWNRNATFECVLLTYEYILLFMYIERTPF